MGNRIRCPDLTPISGHLTGPAPDSETSRSMMVGTRAPVYDALAHANLCSAAYSRLANITPPGLSPQAIAVQDQTSASLRNVSNRQTIHHEHSNPDLHEDIYNGNCHDGRNEARSSYPLHHQPQTHNTTPPVQLPDDAERIEALQEGLRDARDDLLGSRFRLRTKRQELQVVREKTVTTVGAAFDSMRRYFLTQGYDVPQDLESGWVEVDAMRDILGAKEVVYEQTEKDYDLEEWHYTQLENQFVESLSRGPDLPVRDISPADVIEDLTRYSFGFPEILATPTSLGESRLLPHFRKDAMSGYYSHPGLDTAGQREHGTLPGSALGSEELPSDSAGVFAVLQAPIALSAQQLAQYNHLCDNTGKNDIRNKWLQSLQYLDEWMLEVLKASTLQKKWLEYWVPRRSDNETEWIYLVTKHWASDKEEDLMFHSGDTVVSDIAGSQAVSSKAWINLSGVSSLSDSGTEISSDDLILPDGRVGDIMASAKNPAEIKPDDLLDDPGQVTFQASTLSEDPVSPQPAVIAETCEASHFQVWPWSERSSALPEPRDDKAPCPLSSRDSYVLPASTRPTVVSWNNESFNLDGSPPFDASRELSFAKSTRNEGGLKHKTEHFKILAWIPWTKKLDRHHIIRSFFGRRWKRDSHV
jgi:hypothetical protein